MEIGVHGPFRDTQATEVQGQWLKVSSVCCRPSTCVCYDERGRSRLPSGKYTTLSSFYG
jgi:hypothetical protein